MNQKGYPVTKLREVKIPLRDHTYCEKTFKEIKKDDPIATYDASFLCAGYDEGGKDACQVGVCRSSLQTSGPLSIFTIFRATAEDRFSVQSLPDHSSTP